MEQNYQAIELAVKVAAKTGLFFASVDGDYSQAEQQFMENYLAQLGQVGPIEDLKGMFDHVMDQPVTLPDLLADTKQLLDLLPTAVDRQAVIYAMADYAQQVITADGLEHPIEREAFNQWYNALVN